MHCSFLKYVWAVDASVGQHALCKVGTQQFTIFLLHILLLCNNRKFHSHALLCFTWFILVLLIVWKVFFVAFTFMFLISEASLLPSLSLRICLHVIDMDMLMTLYHSHWKCFFVCGWAVKIINRQCTLFLWSSYVTDAPIILLVTSSLIDSVSELVTLTWIYLIFTRVYNDFPVNMSVLFLL